MEEDNLLFKQELDTSVKSASLDLINQQNQLELLDKSMDDRIYNVVQRATLHLQRSDLEDASLGKDDSPVVKSGVGQDQVESIIKMVEEKLGQSMNQKTSKADSEIYMRR